MDQNMKDALKKLYEAPAPVRKRAFLREIGPQPPGIIYVLRTQISYISKWEWIVSVLLFGVTVFMSCFFETAVLSAILALMPFLAAAGISESIRSSVYGMEELEMCARFSLKSIILARMGIIGTENLILALTAALFIQGRFLYTVLYLLVPYLLTAYGGLIIVRNYSGREGIYTCIGFSVIVSLAVSFSLISNFEIYQEQFGYLWAVAAGILMYMNYKECRKMVQRIECYN